MHLNLLTWNVKKKTSKTFYSDLNAELLKRNVDILIFQECFKDYPIIELADYFEIPEFIKHPDQRYVRIFLKTKTTLTYDIPTSDLGNKLRSVKFSTPLGYHFNLIGIHLYSKADNDDSDQLELNLTTASLINQFELRSNSKNTLVVGDFNHHPFDKNLQSTFLFNALNDKELIRTLKTRRFMSVDYPFFYNPMWNLLGDYNYIHDIPKVAGSYYRFSNKKSKFHWNLLDGVVLSNQMMDALLIPTLEILTEINGKALVDYSKVTSKVSLLTPNFSDHLPIYFTIKAA